MRSNSRDRDEVVVDALDFAGALGAGRHRNRELDVGVGRHHGARDRGFARARGRGDHQHDPAARDVDQRLLDVLDLLAELVDHRLEIEADRGQLHALDLEQRVFASRLNSCDRKSSLRPAGPPSAISARAAAIWAVSRSSSSRISALVASSSASCASRSSESAGDGRGQLLDLPAQLFEDRVAAAAGMQLGGLGQGRDLVDPLERGSR